MSADGKVWKLHDVFGRIFNILFEKSGKMHVVLGMNYELESRMDIDKNFLQRT